LAGLSLLRNYVPDSLKQRLRAYRDSEFKWRYIDNLVPTLVYKLQHQRLSDESARILSDLNYNGVAITSVSELLGQDSCYDELKASAESLEHNLTDQIASARIAAGTVTDEKTFLFQLLGDLPVLDPHDVFVRFALQKPILQVANAYLGMYAQLRYYNVWHNLATQAPPLRSQFWHRDQEDRYILKVFVYLSDVDEGAGPFTYAAGSHPKGDLRRDPEHFLEKNRKNKRSNDTQLARIVPPDRWIKGVGPQGTIIFADTRGYHKGGLARTRDRILYNCMFVSQAAKCDVFFKSPRHTFSLPEKALAFALSAYSKSHPQ
jgi:hypothetical protein